MILRIFISLLIALIVFKNGNGQKESTDKSFKSGAKLGLNTSQMMGDGYSGYNKLNIQGGFYLNKHLSESSLIQFELLYIRKGSYDPGDPENGNFNTYRLQLDYIEVPLLYQYNLDKFIFEIGPGIGVLFNTLEEDANGVVPASGFNWRPFEIDAMAGVNYQLNEHVSFNIRIHQSLLSIVSTRIITPYGAFGGAYNSLIGASFNWTF